MQLAGRLWIGLGLAAACCLPLAPAVAEDWYRFRGPRLNGISQETDWSAAWDQNPPQLQWQATVGTGLSGVVLSQGRLFTLGNTLDQDHIVCLDAVSGQPQWQHSYAAAVDANEFEGGPTATPTVDGGRLYSLSRAGDLFCLDAATGQQQWQIQVAEVADVRVPTWGFAGSPLVYDHLLLLNVGDAGVAVDKLSGQLVWKSADRDSGYSSLVPLEYAGQPAVAFGSARSYVCVHPLTGQELWRHRWLTTFGCNAADPVVSGQQVFISSGYNRGSALLQQQLDGVEELWKNKDMQTQISSCVLIDGYLYGIHGDVGSGTQLRCMQWSTGQLMWSLDSISPGGLMAAGERLIVLTDSGELVVVAADPQAARILARQTAVDGKCWTAPTLSNGHIYCRTALGSLACWQLPADQ